MKDMADVLAKHRISAHFTCECGEDFYPDEEDLDVERADEPEGFIKAYEAHQAAALFAAGFGPVQASMETAWDQGFATGKSRAMRAMSDEPNLPLTAPNPYRKASDD